jgi:uncharacterized protein YjiS (DUF1127 family)
MGSRIDRGFPMTTHSTSAASTEQRRSTIHVAARLRHTWKRGWQARRTISTLHRLSDAQLKDIGLRRSEVDDLFVR